MPNPTAAGSIEKEVFDPPGPWHLKGEIRESGEISWNKQYIGKHRVEYVGRVTDQGIQGTWWINDFLTGPFHIWPQGNRELAEKFLREDLQNAESNRRGFH